MTRPKYMDMYLRLRADITSGRYAFDEKLPSKRLFSEENGCSVITTEHCYALLEEEGYIEARERSGYYVCYREGDLYPFREDFAGQPEQGLRERSQPDVRDEADVVGDEEFPFSLLQRTMRRVITEYGEKIMVKPPSSGALEFREAISAYLRRSRGMAVDPGQVVIGSGAEYLYSLLVQILGRDKLYGLEDPSYEKIRQVYEANGASCEMLPIGRDGIPSEVLERAEARILHVTPFNSFPSGVSIGAGKRKEYIRWAQERDGIIIEDDFDSEFTISTKAADTLFSLEPERSVIYLNTFSKSISPSFRIGYMVLPAGSYREMVEKISFYSCTVPAFEQYVLAEFIQRGDFERHINRVRRRRRQTRAKQKPFSE